MDSRMSLRILFSCFLLLTALATYLLGESRKEINADNVQKGFIRGLAATNHHYDYDTDWSFPFVLNPAERKEVNNHASSNFQRTTVGPFVGPLVDLGQDDNKNFYEATFHQRMSRIVNGEEARPHSFFAMLLVKEEQEWRWSGCGGTLISACHLLTAGHCVWNPELPVEGVIINAYRPFGRNNSDVPFHFSDVRRIEVHPNFQENTNEADIAVVSMESCVDIQEFPPALLAEDIQEYTRQYRPPSSYSPAPPLVEVMGFGSMADSENVPADTLRQVQIPYLSRRDCLPYFGKELLEDMVCAGYVDTGGPDACRGDSGGGLIHYIPVDDSTNDVADVYRAAGRRLVPRLVGTVSWGVGCGRKEYPGVYTFTVYYRSWILERICSPPSDLSVSTLNFEEQCRDVTSFGMKTTYDGTTKTIPSLTGGTQEEKHTSSKCRQEGEVCFSEQECCSNLCRIFPWHDKGNCRTNFSSPQSESPERRTPPNPPKRGETGRPRENRDDIP